MIARAARSWGRRQALHLLHLHTPPPLPPPLYCIARSPAAATSAPSPPGPQNPRPPGSLRAQRPPRRSPRPRGWREPGGGGGAPRTHGPAAPNGEHRAGAATMEGCVRSWQSEERLRPLHPGPAASHHPARRFLGKDGRVARPDSGWGAGVGGAGKGRAPGRTPTTPRGTGGPAPRPLVGSRPPGVLTPALFPSRAPDRGAQRSRRLSCSPTLASRVTLLLALPASR